MRGLRRARACAVLVTLALLVPVFASPRPVAAETLSHVDIYGSTAVDAGRGVAVDATGNIYVVGETLGALPGCDPACTSAGNLDLFVRKYAADGTVAWTRQLGSTAKELPSEIAVDAAGNVYVAGTIQFNLGAGALPGQTQVGSSSDGFLVKYSSSGTLLWVRQFGLSFTYATDETDVRGLAVDSSGAAYVSGTSMDIDFTGPCGYIRKYDATGATVWEQRFTAIDGEVDGDWPMPSDLALDSAGSVIAVSGQTYGTLVEGQANPSAGTEAFVATFAAADGSPGWIRQWGTIQSDSAIAVAIDSNGRVVTTSTLGTDAVASEIRQFDSSGSLNWTGQLATLSGRPPQTTGFDVAIGPDDQIAVAGDATGVGTIYPAIWLFASDGTAGWSAIPAEISLYEGVAYAPGGIIYATGHYRASVPALNDMILVRVGPSDTTAPTVTLEQAPGQADPTNASPINFSLAADESLDTATVTAADFDVAGGQIGTIACSGTPTTCTIPITPTADGLVTIAPSLDFSVADVAGNAQTTVGGTDRAVTYATQGPSISASAKVQGTKVTVTFRVTGGDGTAECALEQGTYAACTSPWTTNLTKGTYTLHIRASDALGNVGSADVTFTIKSGKTKP